MPHTPLTTVILIVIPTVTQTDTSLTKHNDLRTATWIQDKLPIFAEDPIPAVDLQVIDLTNHQPGAAKMMVSKASSPLNLH